MNGLVEAGFLLIGGPVEGDRETLHVCTAPSESDVLERFTQDPWAPLGMVVVKTIERWTIILSPPAIDEILAKAPRASLDVYEAPSQR